MIDIVIGLYFLIVILLLLILWVWSSRVITQEENTPLREYWKCAQHTEIDIYPHPYPYSYVDFSDMKQLFMVHIAHNTGYLCQADTLMNQLRAFGYQRFKAVAKLSLPGDVASLIRLLLIKLIPVTCHIVEDWGVPPNSPCAWEVWRHESYGTIRKASLVKVKRLFLFKTPKDA
jgi:hypothetical protein